MQESPPTPELAAPAGSTFLADASRLLAGSLDYEATLAVVAGLALPHLGAWCIVDVVEEDGAMRRLAIVHPDPAVQALARRLERGWPPHVDDPLGAPVVVRTRRPELIPEVTDDMLRAAAHGDENLRLLRALGIGSLMVAPMIARGHVHGAITFVSPQAGYRYGDGDLALAEDLAARAAMAIDNARLLRAADRALSEARAASRAKSEFLATMSHELRTPLNAVVGYAELLEMELAGPLTEGQREQITRIRTSSRHLLGLVDEVLDLARVEAGQLPVAAETARAADAVAEAAEAARAFADARGVTLETACGGAEPCYVGDVGRVVQVLEGLLSNAVKFTPPGGRVRVSCGATTAPGHEARLTSAGPWVCFDVEDTGIGIAPERLAMVFTPFHQEQGGRTRTEEGPGLGLTTARHLARLMGGDVTLKSEVGVGSCFTLWLPAAPESAPRGRREGRERRAAAAAGRALTASLEEVMEAYVRRLRAEIPRAAGDTDTDLADHSATLLADVAQSLEVLGRAAEDGPHLMRDGSRIQRLLAELHADQRRRLGWAVDELRRDYQLLGDEVERCLRARLPAGDAGADQAAEAALRLLRQSERVSVQAFRAAPAGA